MGRWAALYADELAAPTDGSTVKTDNRRVLSVLAVPDDRGAAVFVAPPVLSGAWPAGLDSQPLAAVSWTDGDITRFVERRGRLLRWGWAEDEAERLANKLVTRDRKTDPRVSCTDCGHYRPGRCGNHRQAGLQQPDVGRDLAASLQRCTGFESTGE